MKVTLTERTDGAGKGQWQGYVRDLKVPPNPGAAASPVSTWDVPWLTWVTGRRAGRVGLRLQFRKEKLYLEPWNRFTGFDLLTQCLCVLLR